MGLRKVQIGVSVYATLEVTLLAFYLKRRNLARRRELCRCLDSREHGGQIEVMKMVGVGGSLAPALR